MKIRAGVDHSADHSVDHSPSTDASEPPTNGSALEPAFELVATGAGFGAFAVGAALLSVGLLGLAGLAGLALKRSRTPAPSPTTPEQ